LVVGFGVDVAIEVLKVDVIAMEDPPSLAAQSGYDAVRAVVRRPNADPIVVLSLEHLLESVYRSALSAQEDAA
jgi:chemotaxis signal transduction protein